MCVRPGWAAAEREEGDEFQLEESARGQEGAGQAAEGGLGGVCLREGGGSRRHVAVAQSG